MGIKTSKSEPALLFNLKLTVNEKNVGLKPFIHNILGKICEAMLSELKGVEPHALKEKMRIVIDPKQAKESQVKAYVGSLSLDLNDYVQEMIWKTLTGFLSSLTGITHTHEQLMLATITLEVERE